MWEFRYQDGGTVLHAGNLGFVTAGRGYALYFQTRGPNWNASQERSPGSARLSTRRPEMVRLRSRWHAGQRGSPAARPAPA